MLSKTLASTSSLRMFITDIAAEILIRVGLSVDKYFLNKSTFDLS